MNGRVKSWNLDLGHYHNAILPSVFKAKKKSKQLGCINEIFKKHLTFKYT